MTTDNDRLERLERLQEEDRAALGELAEAVAVNSPQIRNSEGLTQLRNLHRARLRAQEKIDREERDARLEKRRAATEAEQREAKERADEVEAAEEARLRAMAR